MKSKISFYYQSLDIFKKIINILKFLERKYLYKLIFIFISMIMGAFFELVSLISLSLFIRIVLDIGLIDNSNNLSNDGFNHFYFFLLNFFSNLTESNIISNCYAFIFISLITLSVRLLTLRIVFFETAKIGGFIETKCGESLMEVPYASYKNLNISKILTDFNNIPIFVNDVFQSSFQSISSSIVIIFLSYIFNFFIRKYR